MTDLFRVAFDGTWTDLRDAARHLSEEERAKLYKQSRSSIARLLAAFVQDFDKERELLPFLRATLLGDVPPPDMPVRAPPLGPHDMPGRVNLEPTFAAAYVRARCLHVALASPAQLASALKPGHWSTPYIERWEFPAARVLLDRSPLVSLPAFEAWMARSGAADELPYGGELLEMMRSEHPQWLASHRAAANVVLSLAMCADDSDRCGPTRLRDAEKYDEWMLLAPLEDAEPFERSHAFEMPPIECSGYRAQLVGLVDTGHVSRDRVIDLCVAKLRSPLRTASTRAWGSFYSELEITSRERAVRRDVLISLASAAPAPGAKIGVAECERAIEAEPSVAPTLIPQLTLALGHEVGVVAKAAFGVLKKAARFDGCARDVLDVAIGALTSPHKALRVDLEAWLASRAPHEFDTASRSRVLEVWAHLRPETQASLAHLAPDPPAPTGHERPKASEESWRARTSARLGSMPAWTPDTIQAERALAIERYLNTGEWAPLVCRPADFAGALRGPLFEGPPTLEHAAHILLAILGRPVYGEELEQVLWAIARHRDHLATVDLVRLLEPLTATIDRPEVHGEFMTRLGLRRRAEDCVDLALTLAGGAVPSRMRPRGLRDRVEWILRSQCSEPLASPTHANGWLDPVVFADRLRGLVVDDLPLAEILAAHSRLAPVAERLEAAWKRSGLDRAPVGTRQRAALVAALGDDEAFGRLGDQLDRESLSLAQVVRPRGAPRVPQLTTPGGSNRGAYLMEWLDTEGGAQDAVDVALRSARVSPGLQQSFYAEAVASVGLHQVPSSLIPGGLALASLPWISVAEYLDGACRVLTSETPSHRAGWIVGVRQAVRDGRVAPGQLSACVRDLITAGRANKYIDEALGELALGSRVDGELVMFILEDCLAQFEDLTPRVRSMVLERMLEITDTWGLEPSPDARQCLAALARGKGATAEKSRALLALPVAPDAPPRDLSLALAYITCDA